MVDKDPIDAVIRGSLVNNDELGAHALHIRANRQCRFRLKWYITG